MTNKLKHISRYLKTKTRNKIISIKSRLLQFVWDLPTVNLEDIVKEDIQIEAPILEDICLPPHNQVYNDHDDLIPLLRIIRQLQPQIVLELGTAYGNMTANICRQCPSAKVYTVNAPADKQTGVITTYSLNEGEIGRVYKKYGFSDQVTQIFENTLNLNLSRYLNKSSVDLAVIDACHDTEYVLNDFAKVNPFIRNGGIVLFHDTHPSMKAHLIGSYTACMLLRRKEYDVSHIRDTWWGAWIKK